MTNIHAAIGQAQLPKLEGFNERRIANAAYLSEHLPQDMVQVPQVRPGTRHVFHQYTVRVLPPLERDALRAHLTAKGVGSEVYYPVPVHRQQLYREMGYSSEGFQESEKAAQEVLSLPIHPGLSQQDLETIVASVLAMRNEE
jgi:dTDP-4-amino-4,6-dideoxygalactose transaminase